MQKALAFVHYTLGLIDASPDGLDEVKTNLIREKLKDLFIHEIDPSYGFTEAEEKETNSIHANNMVDNESKVMRC